MLQNQNEPAKLISLIELFDGRKFEVPDYQRGYSWDEEQVLDLLSDIEMHNSKSGHKHFTGTIVVERPNGGNTYQIVDGQQRLVTCVMILRAIVEMNPRKLKGLESILTKTKSGFETSITLGDYDNDFFESLILNGDEQPIETSSNKRLSICYKAISDWLKVKDRDVQKILNGLTTQLGFIFFETSSARETTTMFEVINNRGKELSELEKFKNYFLHLCHTHDFAELESKIHSKWREILINLEKAGVDTIQKENQFVRIAFGVIFWKVKKDVTDLYREFRNMVNTRLKEDDNYFIKSENQDTWVANLQEDLELYFDFLESSALAYAYLFNFKDHFRDQGRDMYSERLDYIFKKLRNHGSIGNVMPVFLVLMKHYFNNRLCSEAIIDVIDMIEKLNFRFYCLPKIFYRSDTQSSHLFALAASVCFNYNFSENGDFINENDISFTKSPGYYERIKKHIVNLVQIYCPEAKFVEALTLDKNETYDFYSWSSLKFFLALYEFKLRTNLKNAWNYEDLLLENDAKMFLTKEHILAVDNSELSDEKASLEKRRLGNFILVNQALNNKLGTHDVKKKMEFIRDNIAKSVRLKHVDEVVDLFFKVYEGPSGQGKKTRNKKEQIVQMLFDLRETKMIKFALQEWAYPGEPEFKFEKVDTLEAERKKLNTIYFFKD